MDINEDVIVSIQGASMAQKGKSIVIVSIPEVNILMIT